MKIAKIFFVGFILSCTAYSQNNVLHQTISWQSKIKNPGKHASKGNEYILTFKHAVYPKPEKPFPYYTDVIKLPGAHATLTIENIEYQTFSREELLNIGQLNELGAEPILTYNIFKQRKQPVAQYTLLPLRRNPVSGQIERVTAFDIKVDAAPVLKSASALKTHRHYASNSVLSSGKWIKIKVKKDGVYKLTYSELTEMGISEPGQVRIYGNGGKMLPIMNSKKVDVNLKQIPIWFEDVNSDGFGSGDYIVFYAEGPVKWDYNDAKQMFLHSIHLFSNASYYFISSDMGRGQVINDAAIETGNIDNKVYSFDDYAYHEQEDESILNSGNRFFENISLYQSYDYDFYFPNLLKKKPVRLRTRVVAGSRSQSQFNISANSQFVQNIKVQGVYPGSYNKAAGNTGYTSFNVSQNNVNLSISYINNDPSSTGWLDYITLNVRRELRMNGTQMLFRDIESVSSGDISQFFITNAKSDHLVWDVTDIHNPQRIVTDYSGDTIKFKVRTDSLRQFIAFDKSVALMTPVYKGEKHVGVIENQNLHGLEQPDMIIVTHRGLENRAEKLAQFHRDMDDLDVVVAEQFEIFNEFSSGSPDVSAIRNFVKMFYDQAANEDQIPKYLLLFGDGSYKNRSFDENNWILTYQSPESLSEAKTFVTDDFFGLLDDNEGGTNGLLDIGIGRMPVSSNQMADVAINKIMHYTSKKSLGKWRNNLTFVSDDQDGESIDGVRHMDDANKLAKDVELKYPEFNITKLLSDAFRQINTATGERYPDVHTAVMNKINTGTLIFNYSGHGGGYGLAHEKILQYNDVFDMENYNMLPLFVTASCEITRFDEHEHVSLGEYIFMNEKGGGIALFSTTRLVYASNNYYLNKSFYKYVFERDKNNKRYRLGDVNMLTKVNLGMDNNKRKFALFGDPALMLAYPDKNVVTTKINNAPVTAGTDTLKALEQIKIEGEIQDIFGNKIDAFNGIVYPVIYDKESKISALINDQGGSAFSFYTRNNIIFKGKASVKQGDFSFNFLVPKDIGYNYGTGKIIYYAVNNANNTNYRGGFEDFIIGGSSDKTYNDDTGPAINLYLNNEEFVSGSITDENPTIFAVVSDSSGINTVSQSIGHGITAVIDGNTDKKIDLSEYYESDLDSYKKGTINYPLADLTEGAHKLTLKVWDVHNNSSEKTIDFVVSNSSNLEINHLLNYPNPFTTNTGFYFEHNQPGSELNVLIQIFTVSGKLVKTIKKTITPDGYRAGPIYWDGLDDYGDKIGRGVYLYHIKVRSNNMYAEKNEKLVILR